MGSPTWLEDNLPFYPYEKKKDVPHTSIAYWPAEAKMPDNKTTDRHRSEGAARGVCKLLREKGFGGRGKIFPLRTEVVPTDE